MNIIDAIADGESLSFYGDVIVAGSVGENVTLVVNNGSLTIQGDVAEGTQIYCSEVEEVTQPAHTNEFFAPSNAPTIQKICITGNVAANVKIDAFHADIQIYGSVGAESWISTRIGDLNVGDVGPDAILETAQGRLNAKDIHGTVQMYVNGPSSSFRILA